jgi:hypothetical protein
MKSTIRLGAATTAALEAGVPAVLVAAILTIQHRGRLVRLFGCFAARFLDAFAEARLHPSSRHAVKRLHRAKAAVDLIRARHRALGQARPNDQCLLDWARDADIPRIVPLRRAA